MTVRARDLFNQYVLGSLNSPELKSLPLGSHVFNLTSAAGEQCIPAAEMVEELGPLSLALQFARV